MDECTAKYYSTHARKLADDYEAAPSGVDAYFRHGFAQGTRVLDVGAGSGRDMQRLLEMGCDVYGVEPCDELRAEALERHPGLRGRLERGELPKLGQPFGGQFGGVLCSAVLMHLSRAEIFDAAVAIRGALREGARLLLSIPGTRPGSSAEHRDEHGRLDTPLAPDYLELLFERLGFDMIGRWLTEDGQGRPGCSWCVLLFQIRHAGTLRPLDQIEGILSRDRKTATYKLALFRALSEIAVTQFEQARWRDDGMVAVPLDMVAERWLHYFWPIVASREFIPQIWGESQGCAMPIAFRSALARLEGMYQKMGGLTAFALDYRSGRLTGDAAGLLVTVLKQIQDTIVKGPVTYAGGSLETGRIFAYDARGRQITMSASIWRELSLLGHWIQDAVVLRWAELTSEISRGALRPSQVIDLLLTTPIAERDVRDAKEVYRSLPRKECIWTGAPLHTRFGVDHIIPFSLWRNNDLWNLVPALSAINSKKSDRLPTRDLMIRRQDCLVHYWHVLREAHGPRFEYELCRVIGENALPPKWEAEAFAAVAEAVEFTALQRGCERWEP